MFGQRKFQSFKNGKYSAEWTSFDSICCLMHHIKWGLINLAILIRSFFLQLSYTSQFTSSGRSKKLYQNISIVKMVSANLKPVYNIHFRFLLEKKIERFLFSIPIEWSWIDILFYFSLRLKMTISTFELKCWMLCFYCVVIFISGVESLHLNNFIIEIRIIFDYKTVIRNRIENFLLGILLKKSNFKMPKIRWIPRQNVNCEQNNLQGALISLEKFKSIRTETVPFIWNGQQNIHCVNVYERKFLEKFNAKANRRIESLCQNHKIICIFSKYKYDVKSHHSILACK